MTTTYTINAEISGDYQISASVASVTQVLATVQKGTQESRQYLELKSLTKVGQNSYYKEFTFVDGNPTSIDVWTDSGKATKLFTKSITWSAGNATDIVVTDEQSGVVLTTALTYDGDGNVDTITEFMS